MKLILELPENKVPFIMEMLSNFSYIKTKTEPIEDTTTYLLSTNTNKKQLMQAVQDFKEKRNFSEHTISEK